ncbi:MAG TPA: glycosyltransferase [Verrucomicrobiae bacterium]|nr:glycosyltransferase [Verrucomicrobiae bacterium]
MNSQHTEPRVCLVSQRNISKWAAWCSNYEFEDVICAVDDVELLNLEAGWALAERRRLQRALLHRRLSKQLARINPGLRPLKLRRDYEIFAFVCMNPQDLLYLNAVQGWKERCKTKICYITEVWTSWISKFDAQLSLLKDFDHIFLCFSRSVAPLSEFLGRPCHHLPLGVDVLRYTPYPRQPARCVDVYSIGRRIPATHEALLKLARNQEIFYMHDTILGDLIQPADYRQHRDLVANVAKRSRYFVAYPALVGLDPSQGQPEVGARYFEGAAAGAALIGQAPANPVFNKDFDWPDAVIEIGAKEDDFREATAKFRKDPDRLAALSRKNAVEALRRFDWAYRWREMAETAGFECLPGLQQRQKHLNEVASLAGSMSMDR